MRPACARIGASATRRKRDDMGLLGLLRQDRSTREITRDAVREARRKAATERGSGPLQKMVESFRDIGLDGKATFASASTAARRASKKGRRREEKAIARIIRSHRRGVTAGGFLSGLGGFVTLPVLLPLNVFEFYVQATRMVGAIASVRGYDLSDDEIRTRVLACLVGEESQDVLANVGLGPVAGAASRRLGKRLRGAQMSSVTSAIGARVLKRFGLRSVRLFGKAVPGLGAVIGAVSDRRQLSRIAESALEEFPRR